MIKDTAQTAILTFDIWETRSVAAPSRQREGVTSPPCIDPRTG